MEIEERNARLLPLGGVAYAAAMVAGAAVFPLPSGGDDAPGLAPAWLAHHTGAVLAQGYLRAAGAVAFVVLALAVADAVRRSGGSRVAAAAALTGGAAAGLLLLAAQGFAIASAVATRADDGADVVRALGYAQDAALTISSLPATLLFAAAGATFLRRRVVAPWLAWATLAGVPFAVLDAASYDGGPFESLGFAGLLYFLVWSLAVGFALMARRTAAVAVPELAG